MIGHFVANRTVVSATANRVRSVAPRPIDFVRALSEHNGPVATNIDELSDVVLRNTSEISELARKLTLLTAKETRAEGALQDVRRRLQGCLDGFDRDTYKGTDQRLLIDSIAHESLIYAKLGYVLGYPYRTDLKQRKRGVTWTSS